MQATSENLPPSNLFPQASNYAFRGECATLWLMPLAFLERFGSIETGSFSL